MPSTTIIVIALTAGVSFAAGSDVFCQQGACPCGQCAFPGKTRADCYPSPLRYANVPTSRDTGGSCRWLGCNSWRGPAVYCSSDYKCLCKEGYFADSAGACVAAAAAQCWTQGSTCAKVRSACRMCDGLHSPSYYQSQIQQLVQDARHLDNEMQSSHHHWNENAYPISSHECAACLLKKNVVAQMEACSACLQVCSQSSNLELAQNSSTVELAAEPKDVSQPAVLATVGLLLGGVATAFASKAFSRAQNAPTLPESMLG